MEVTPQELDTRLKNGEDILLLDVREPDERALTHIGGTHIPMGEITARINELDDDVSMVVYCHHGVRSAHVVAYLRQQGFEQTYNLKGGIDRWSCDVDNNIPRY